MTEKKKLSAKRILVICLLSTGALAIAVILVTCKMFDEPMFDIGPDWNSIVKGSTWTLNDKNVSEEANCVVCMKSVNSVSFSEDLALTINYGQYSFDAGKFIFDTNKKIRQASDQGYVENILTFTFSQQAETYLMTIDVIGVGSYYFFKN